jgi:hypothetical protein
MGWMLDARKPKGAALADGSETACVLKDGGSVF